MTTWVLVGLATAITFTIAIDVSTALRVARRWASYATQRGYRLDAPGLLPSRETMRLRAVSDDTTIAFTLLGSGRTTRTRASAKAIRALPLVLVLYDRRIPFVGTLRQRAGNDEIPLDPPSLGTRYAMHATNAPLARELLDEPALDAFLRMLGRRDVAFTYDEGEVQLSWAGAEEHEELLDAARDIVARACRWRPDAAAYR